jgi:glycosyltransferase involved in cell wall biosynthesis
MALTKHASPESVTVGFFGRLRDCCPPLFWGTPFRVHRGRYNGGMQHRTLTALPVYNEAAHVCGVLDEVVRYSEEVLVVDDGSTDGTSRLLAGRDDIHVVTHSANRGYGAALSSAFDFALRCGYETLVTIDCDGQHEPQRIGQFIEARREGVDIVSGSRYFRRFPGQSRPPESRRRINRAITEELNRRLGVKLTDAFCGFKAYRVAALADIELTETGYAMPLELWVRAAALGLHIVELPVPLIYLEEERSFGGSLDDAETRLAVYREVLRRSVQSARRATHPIRTGIACEEDSA